MEKASSTPVIYTSARARSHCTRSLHTWGVHLSEYLYCTCNWLQSIHYLLCCRNTAKHCYRWLL